MNARAVYRPITDGTKVMVSSIPGRQGFYEFEEIQMAWLVADGSPQINVILETSVVSFKFEMYRIVEDYPLEDIVIRFNGEVVSRTEERRVGKADGSTCRTGGGSDK